MRDDDKRMSNYNRKQNVITKLSACKLKLVYFMCDFMNKKSVTIAPSLSLFGHSVRNIRIIFLIVFSVFHYVLIIDDDLCKETLFSLSSRTHYFISAHYTLPASGSMIFLFGFDKP